MSIQPPDPAGPGASRPERPAERPPAADDAAHGAPDPGPVQTPPLPPPADVVDFSAEAGAPDAGADAAARAELVERLRAELAAGGYRVDADAVARALAAAEDEL